MTRSLKYYYLALYRKSLHTSAISECLQNKNLPGYEIWSAATVNKFKKLDSLYLVFVSTEQFSEHLSRTIRGPKRLGQHSSLIQVCRQNSVTRSAVFTISTVAR